MCISKFSLRASKLCAENIYISAGLRSAKFEKSQCPSEHIKKTSKAGGLLHEFIQSGHFHSNSNLPSRDVRILHLDRTPKRILVTGGAGFLGSHLCERLLSDGNQVLCLDNFSTGHDRNISHLRRNAGFKVLRHDVGEHFIAEVDEIYNLAAPHHRRTTSPIRFRP